MVDPLSMSRLLHYALFVGIALIALFGAFLPLDIGAPNWPGPQLMICFGAAWVLRRPDYLPIALIATLALMSDFLMQRPPGLWAGLVILAIEFLRSRAFASREWPFLLEWLIFALILIFMLLANRLVLAIFVVDQPRFGIEAQQLLSSVAIYPVAVWISVYFMGLRRGQTTSWGGKN